MIRVGLDLSLLWFRSLLWQLQEAAEKFCPCGSWEES